MIRPPAATDPVPSHTVAVVTLGCARNEVDSEELAGRLAAAGFDLVDDPSAAETVMVNTCGFIESAKKDSIDTLLQAADLKEDGTTRSVIAVGCMAERYGAELADALPEADAVLGFDDYPDIAARLRAVLAGEALHPHTPSDRRRLLPITPVERADAPIVVPGTRTVHMEQVPGSPATGPQVLRRRLDTGPMAPLKIASGCDRRCTFCAIPRFRGAFISRPPEEILAEAAWLAGEGVKEVFLVSENTTSYGKDLGDTRLLDSLLPRLAGVAGIERVRVSYLQPAELRPDLIAAIARTDGVADYFDLSFQHVSAPVLRRMRRFGDPDSFLALLDHVRAAAPAAGIRSNFIVGFPGETGADFAAVCDFVAAARLDAIGVFGYSDEDNTEAMDHDDKLDAGLIAERVAELTAVAEETTAQRAEERIGEAVHVLVEHVDPLTGQVEGRTQFQGPEVDGTTTLTGIAATDTTQVGDIIAARVVDTVGVDLVAAVGVAR